ncbi:hypothetical protein MHYP_G00157220 [Metynnis hypsauchen]
MDFHSACLCHVTKKDSSYVLSTRNGRPRLLGAGSPGQNTDAAGVLHTPSLYLGSEGFMRFWTAQSTEKISTSLGQQLASVLLFQRLCSECECGSVRGVH